MKRWTPDFLCPICGGHPKLPRGLKKRCAGFLSADGKYAHCTREEHAGGIQPSNAIPATYAHILNGPCLCGKTHGPAGDPPRRKNKPKQITAIYDYTSESGDLLFQVVRLEDKSFFQRRPDGNGGWILNLDGVRRVPYRLRELLDVPHETVFVTEGEKDVDRLVELGILATCNSGGAGKWLDEYAEYFRDRECIIIMDNDDPGRSHVQDVARSLYDVASTVRVLELPGVAEKGDVSDYLDAGHTIDDLLTLVEATSKWEPTEAQTSDDPAVPRKPFPLHVLPEPLKSYVTTRADALGASPEYIAVPLLAAVAGVIGNTRVIKLKRTWTEPAIVWAVVVARSGTLKTPALEVALAPVQWIENAERKDYEKGLADYKQELEIWEGCKREEREVKPEQPIAVRLIVSDTTTEALAMILSENPRGVMLARDELGGWLGAFDGYKKTRGADESFWNQSFRALPHTVDRKGDRQSIYISRLTVSVTGTIQPRVLARMLGNEHFESGLAARLLLVMPDSLRKQWTEDEGDQAIDEDVERLFLDLWALEQNQDQHGDLAPVELPLTTSGAECWIDFFNRWNDNQAGDDEDAAADSKLEAYAARFALLFALVRNPNAQAVDGPDIEAGSALTWWFRDEIRQVYDVLRAPAEQREKVELEGWIRARGGEVTARDLQREGPRRYRGSAADAESALDKLVQAGLGVWVDRPTKGRSARPFRLNGATTEGGAK